MTQTSPWLTIVIVFYNNQREAKRTLYTFSTPYQRSINNEEYNVIAIDSNSPKPLNKAEVEAFGPNFQYHFFETDSVAPCAALNWGIQQAKTPYIMCLIDGAHMVTPNLLAESKTVFSLDSNAFVYTAPFHLGKTLQNEAILQGYNQEEEDKLLESIDWKNNGYRLFTISEVQNANHSFFTHLNESNCFAVSREKLLSKGGFNEQFQTIGGGMVNLELFRQMVNDPDVKPVGLIGEASFHQFHGGVSTNIERKEHPIGLFREEYQKIKGFPYVRPRFKPYYWGTFPDDILEHMPISSYREILRLARKMSNSGMGASAIDMLKSIKDYQRLHPSYYLTLGFCYKKMEKWTEAEQIFEKAVNLAPESGSLVALAEVLLKQNKPIKALKKIEDNEKFDFDNLQVLILKASIYYRLKQEKEADKLMDKVVKILETTSANSIKTYIELLRLCVQRNKLVRAKKILIQGDREYPDNYSLYLLKARVLIKSKEYAECEMFLKGLLRQFSGSQAGHLLLILAECYDVWNKPNLAKETYAKTALLIPNHPRIKKWLKTQKKAKAE